MCFPSIFSGSGVKFPHAEVESRYLLPQCGMCKFFLVASLSRRDCCFSHVVSYVVDTFGDCCKLLGSHFGHDRAKNDSGVVFPV